jgi:NodT family efflux transporter outer membrane factor (OMF) lipoprotein
MRVIQMKKMGLIEMAAGISVVLGCSSCTSLYAPEAREIGAMPSAYSTERAGVSVTNEWWTAFGDEQLNRLVAQALGGNLTIEQAAARLRQAEASAVKSGADRFPSLTGSADADTDYEKDDGAKVETTDDFGLGLSASYELDLWGRVAAEHRAARASLDATRFDLQSAAMSVAGETAETYFKWQQLQARKAVLLDQLAARRKMLSSIEKRFHTAQSDALAVLQQRERVAAAEAAIPPVDASIESTAHALAVLVGVPPQTDLGLVVKDQIELPERPMAGLPADLLARRPDLSAAWARLAAADWNVSSARADRMPAITLTGSFDYGDESVSALFDNWVLNLAAGLSAPLIDGGSLRAEVARTRAAADEQVAAYRAAVLDALTEVEDALSAEARQQEYLQAVRRQLSASSDSATESFTRYTRGMDSYFEALSAETSRQSLALTELQASCDLLTDRVQLYRVLGGDWGMILEAYRATDEQGENNER